MAEAAVVEGEEVAEEVAVVVDRNSVGAHSILGRCKVEKQYTSALAETDVALRASRQTLQETIEAIAILSATLQQREGSLHKLVQQQLQLLQEAVTNADQRVNRVVENALPRLTQLTNQALAQTLGPAAERFNRKLASADQTLHQATQRYAQAQQSLETTAARRIWMASIAMLAAGVIGLGVAGYALYSSKATLAQAAQRRSEIAYLDRIGRADLVPCGEDRLCANVEKKGKRYGDQGQYRVIGLRRPSPP